MPSVLDHVKTAQGEEAPRRRSTLGNVARGAVGAAGLGLAGYGGVKAIKGLRGLGGGSAVTGAKNLLEGARQTVADVRVRGGGGLARGLVQQGKRWNTEFGPPRS